MRGRRTLGIALLALACCLAPAHAGSRIPHPPEEATVRTDGHLRPGHLETIRVAGFPGKGGTEVSFFPTAICESRCSANGRTGSKTNALGAARIQVRVPGTFFGRDGKRAYFRDGERIDLNVVWIGPHHKFDVAFANPDPVIVRTHGHRRQ